MPGFRCLDLIVVDAALVLIRREDHDEVGPLGGGVDGHHREAGLFGLLDRLRAGLEADDDLDARVAQVHRVRVPLRAVTDDGYLLALDDRQVGVIVVVHLSHEWPPSVVGGICWFF